MTIPFDKPFDKPFDYTQDTAQDALRTQLCAGDTHVFQLGSTACDCGLWGAAAQPANPSIKNSGHGPYPLYYPQGYRPQQTTPPTAGEAPPLHVFEAAQRAGASHLSADGRRIYCQRLGAVLQAEWDGNGWGSWWSCAGLPPDAVAM